MIYDPTHLGYARTRAELERDLERLEFRKRGLRAQLSDVIHRVSIVEREHIRLSNNLRTTNLTGEGETGEQT